MSAAKQRRYRERKAEGKYTLRGSLAINGESLVRISEAGMIPQKLLMTDSDTLDAVSAWLDFTASPEALRALAQIMLDKLSEFE